MHSQITENYLKALFNLSLEDEDIAVSTLSEDMGVSLPTANSMIKKLHQQGFVNYQKYKPVRLTPKGRKTSALIIRKHRLTEMFLVEIMGLGWEEVHDIAEQIEHVQSPLFFDKIDAMLGHPTRDPHGSPIPDKEGHIIYPDYTVLSDCQAGETVRLMALANSSQSFMRFLNKKDLALGLDLKILEKEDFDGSLTVSYYSHAAEHLSKEVCDKLLVNKE
jgi:DtxR family Mn-dependent transcriptional regulator